MDIKGKTKVLLIIINIYAALTGPNWHDSLILLYAKVFYSREH